MSGGPRLAVVDYGVGNLRSAEKAFQRIGADTRLTANVAEITAADGVIVPGVGAFAGSVAALDSSGLRDVVTTCAIEAREGSGVPFLGICVGLQMLYESSDEAPEVAGLGVLAGRVSKLVAFSEAEALKLPQMQWNQLRVDSPDHPLFAGLIGDPWCYFVHGYAAPIGSETIARCDYGGSVCAAVGVKSLAATQFHPEKSGRVGLAILANFASMCSKRTGAE